MLTTDSLGLCISTLESSLDLYRQSSPGSITQEVFRNAIIQSELSQETSFKLLKRALKDFGYSSRNFDSTTVKDLLRLAGVHGLMSVNEIAGLGSDSRCLSQRDRAPAHPIGVLIPELSHDSSIQATVS